LLIYKLSWKQEEKIRSLFESIYDETNIVMNVIGISHYW